MIRPAGQQRWAPILVAPVARIALVPDSHRKGIEMSEVVKEKIKEIVNGFDEVQKEVKAVTDTIITQRDYISSIFEQTRVSDDILLEIHNKLINHVERASKVDTNLEEALTKLKNLL